MTATIQRTFLRAAFGAMLIATLASPALAQRLSNRTETAAVPSPRRRTAGISGGGTTPA
jgi:hypothetical protein